MTASQGKQQWNGRQDEYLSSDHVFVDALRTFLGLKPIHGSEGTPRYWQGWSFYDGNRHVSPKSLGAT